MSYLHLAWIIPLCVYFGMLLASLVRANDQKEDNMNYSTERFSLDLNDQDSQVYVTVRQGDTAKKLSVMLKESGTPYSIADGTAAVLAAQKPAGTYINASCTISAGNRLEIVLPAAFTETAGRHRACFVLTGNDAALTSPPFTIDVEAPAATVQTTEE